MFYQPFLTSCASSKDTSFFFPHDFKASAAASWACRKIWDPRNDWFPCFPLSQPQNPEKGTQPQKKRATPKWTSVQFDTQSPSALGDRAPWRPSLLSNMRRRRPEMRPFSAGCGSKNWFPKWNPGTWKHGLEPVVPWWFNFDPCPSQAN